MSDRASSGTPQLRRLLLTSLSEGVAVLIAVFVGLRVITVALEGRAAFAAAGAYLAFLLAIGAMLRPRSVGVSMPLFAGPMGFRRRASLFVGAIAVGALIGFAFGILAGT